LKLEMNKYCETKLISKMDIYFETEEVLSIVELLINLARLLKAIYILH